MTDDRAPAQPTESARCTWCSAELPAAQATVCPSCGATLVGEGDPQVPGVTALDAEAIVRAARAPLQRPRSRLLSWISGEYEDEKPETTPAAPDSLALPSVDVQREMLRLELAAEVANLEAEAGSIAAEAEIQAREAGRVPFEPSTVDEESATNGTADAGTTPAADAADSNERSTPA